MSKTPKTISTNHLMNIEFSCGEFVDQLPNHYRPTIIEDLSYKCCDRDVWSLQKIKNNNLKRKPNNEIQKYSTRKNY